jgi:hypothetical protein
VAYGCVCRHSLYELAGSTSAGQITLAQIVLNMCEL